MTTHARVTLLSGLIISALLLTGCDNSGNPQPHAQAPQVTVHVVNSAPLSVTTETARPHLCFSRGGSPPPGERYHPEA